LEEFELVGWELLLGNNQGCGVHCFANIYRPTASASLLIYEHRVRGGTGNKNEDK
jgi:hypothetical protein